MAIVLVELGLWFYGPIWHWFHMLRFDSDGSGFIEPNEMTPEQVRADEASYQDTWRFGLTFATPFIYLFMAIIAVLSNKITIALSKRYN